jgi:hypothetical protein
MFLWAIYLFPWSVCLFCCRTINQQNVEIYRSLVDTWMWKMGLRPHNSFFGITSIQIYVQCGLWVCVTCVRGGVAILQSLPKLASSVTIDAKTTVHFFQIPPWHHQIHCRPPTHSPPLQTFVCWLHTALFW